MYWTEREPIQENRSKRLNFIKGGLEEIDYDINIKLRNIKPDKSKKYD